MATLVPEATKRLTLLQQDCEEALSAYKRAQTHMAGYTVKEPVYEEGDLVWLEGSNLHIANLPKKLAPRRYGPFPIIKKLSKVAYRLRLPACWHIHNVFHASLLTPFTSSPQSSQKLSSPLPDLVDGNEEWEVERILQDKFIRGKQHFLVRWKGYSSAEDTWEPKRNLMHAKEVLSEYLKETTA